MLKAVTKILHFIPSFIRVEWTLQWCLIISFLMIGCIKSYCYLLLITIFPLAFFIIYISYINENKSSEKTFSVLQFSCPPLGKIKCRLEKSLITQRANRQIPWLLKNKWPGLVVTHQNEQGRKFPTVLLWQGCMWFCHAQPSLSICASLRACKPWHQPVVETLPALITTKFCLVRLMGRTKVRQGQCCWRQPGLRRHSGESCFGSSNALSQRETGKVK